MRSHVEPALNRKTLMTFSTRFGLMSIILLLLARFAYADLSSQIPSDNSPNGRLLSYYELMLLPEKQRIDYIQGVRDILVDLSRNPGAKFADVDSGAQSQLKVWLRFFESQLARAAADSGEVPPAAILQRTPRSDFKVLSGVPNAKKKKIYLTEQEFAEDVARGRIPGFPRCQSESLPSYSTQESAKWRDLPKCSAEVESTIQKKFESSLRAETVEVKEPTPASSPVATSFPVAQGPVIEAYPLPPLLNEPQQPAVRSGKSVSIASLPTCAPKPETCESREKIRAIYDRGNLPCVFAGMISKLSNGNRRCEAVTDFKLGEKTFKCESGQTMCNPILFGTVFGSKPETPICVGRGQDVTVQCSKISRATDAEQFLNRNILGIQDKWNEFKRELETVCKVGTLSFKFHCQECNVMRLRLFELHARLVKNPCGTELEDVLKKRIKDRSAPAAR
jgi:hypothetical protein